MAGFKFTIFLFIFVLIPSVFLFVSVHSFLSLFVLIYFFVFYFNYSNDILAIQLLYLLLVIFLMGIILSTFNLLLDYLNIVSYHFI